MIYSLFSIHYFFELPSDYLHIECQKSYPKNAWNRRPAIYCTCTPSCRWCWCDYGPLGRCCFILTKNYSINYNDNDSLVFKFNTWFFPPVRMVSVLKTRTRKRGNCECLAIWDRLTPRFNYDAMPSLNSLNISNITVLLLLVRYFALWPWPLTFDLEHLQRIACDVMNFCTKFERNRSIRGEVIAISVFDLMTLNSIRLWDNFYQVWPSTIRAWIIAFFCWYFLSCCHLDLWSVDLESSWYIKRHVIKVCTKFERNRAIRGLLMISWFLHTLFRTVTLTFDLLTLNFYVPSIVMCLSSVQNLSKIESAELLTTL